MAGIRGMLGLIVGFMASVSAVPGLAQSLGQRDGLTIEVSPNQLTLGVGEKATLVAVVRDADGKVVDDATVVYFSRARRSVAVTRGGEVEAHRPGDFILVALVPEDAEHESTRPDAGVRVEISVTVPKPSVKRLTFTRVPPRFYTGTRSQVMVEVVDEMGDVRSDASVSFTSSESQIATVDRFGFLTLLEPGKAEIAATAEEISEILSIEIEVNPMVSLDLLVTAETASTGDVLRFTALPRDARGRVVRDMPMWFAVGGQLASGIIAAGAAAQIDQDGWFVAERSGTYTVIASTGSDSAARTVLVEPRSVGREIEVVGRGKVLDRHTSDLWVWEGGDGRDYAITGTWGADGRCYIWDVSDPSNIERLREVKVDARTINDVKVSEDGDIAVISREGASDRRNGIVILGVGNPREGAPVLSEFAEELTGGVHNVFISGDYVFALSAGRRYDVISIEDPRNPKRVSRFELETPGHGIHDIWVSDGVAFSSNWTDGVVAVDVGGGGRGGTPERPVELGRYAYPNGWNHAAFPYKSQSTGKFLLFAGDEAFPYGGYRPERGGVPSRAAGWVHVIDWSDWGNPHEIARFQVPEAGSHNLWIEDDVMFAAFYNGGLRVVDVSGDLRGDLYKQGREIAMFLPGDPGGFIANAPFVWGAQPFKGHIFFTDWNTGLWAVKLVDRNRQGHVIGEPR